MNLPRSKVLDSSGSCSRKSEGMDGERAACNRVHAVRALAIATIAFAFASALVACVPNIQAWLVCCFASVATGSGLVAILSAVGVKLADGQLVGLGFILHCCGTFSSALGTALTLRWAMLPNTHEDRSARELKSDVEMPSEREVPVLPEMSSEAAQPSDKPIDVALTTGPESSNTSDEFIDTDIGVCFEI